MVCVSVLQRKQYSEVYVFTSNLCKYNRHKACTRLDGCSLLHKLYQLSPSQRDGARFRFFAGQPHVITGWLALLRTKAEAVELLYALFNHPRRYSRLSGSRKISSCIDLTGLFHRFSGVKAVG